MPTSFHTLPRELRLKVYDFATPHTDITIPIRVDQAYKYEQFNQLYQSRVEAYPVLSLPQHKEFSQRTHEDAPVLSLMFVCRKFYDDLSPIVYSSANIKLIANSAIPQRYGRHRDAHARPTQFDIMRFLRSLSASQIIGNFLDNASTISISISLLDGLRRMLKYRREGELQGLRTLILYEDAVPLRDRSQYSGQQMQLPHLRDEVPDYALLLVDARRGWLRKMPTRHGIDVRMIIPYAMEICEVHINASENSPHIEFKPSDHAPVMFTEMPKDMWSQNEELRHMEQERFVSELYRREEKRKLRAKMGGTSRLDQEQRWIGDDSD